VLRATSRSNDHSGVRLGATESRHTTGPVVLAPLLATALPGANRRDAIHAGGKVWRGGIGMDIAHFFQGRARKGVRLEQTSLGFLEARPKNAAVESCRPVL
jgi:hypothetical protein